MTTKESFRTDRIAKDVLNQTFEVIRQHSIEFPDTGALCKRLMRRIKEKFRSYAVKEEENKRPEEIHSDSEEVEIDRLVRKIHKANNVLTLIPGPIKTNSGAVEEQIFEMTFSVLKGLVEETRLTTREKILRIWKDSKKNLNVLRTIAEFAATAPSKAEMLFDLVNEIAIEEFHNGTMLVKVFQITISLALTLPLIHTARAMVNDEDGADFRRMILNLMEFLGHFSRKNCFLSDVVDDMLTKLFEEYETYAFDTSEVLIQSAVRFLTIGGQGVDKKVVDEAMVRIRKVFNRVDEKTRTQISNLETLRDYGWK